MQIKVPRSKTSPFLRILPLAILLMMVIAGCARAPKPATEPAEPTIPWSRVISPLPAHPRGCPLGAARSPSTRIARRNPAARSTCESR